MRIELPHKYEFMCIYGSLKGNDINKLWFIYYLLGNENRNMINNYRFLQTHSDSDTTMTSQMLKLDINSTTNCKFCKKAFKSIVAAKNHERYIHKFTLLHCKVCEKECTSKLILRNHIKMHRQKKCSQFEIILNGNNYFEHEAKA